MYSEANKILHDKYLAEDAVQQLFLKVIDNLHKIFLLLFCRNVAKTTHNKKCLNGNIDDIENLTPISFGDSLDPPDIVIDNESVTRIVKAIEEPPVIYRDTLLF